MGKQAGQVPGQGGTGSLRVQAGGQGERLACRGQGRGRKTRVRGGGVRGEGGAVSGPGSEASLVRGGSGEMESEGCCPWGRLIMDKVGSREGEARGRGA